MNFSRKEFSCKCGCGFDAIDYELLQVLEEIRDYFTSIKCEECYILITSGNRCAWHNKLIGGSRKSQHIKGKAADFKVFIKSSSIQVPSDEVHDKLLKLYPDKYGIGKYKGRTHIDVRDYKARWCQPTNKKEEI